MFCHSCGQSLVPGANFCSSCGQAVVETLRMPSPPPPQQPAAAEARPSAPPPQMPAAAQVPPPAAAAAEGKPHNNLAKKMGGWGKIKDELQQIVPQAAPDKVLAVKVHVAATKDDSLEELLIAAFQVAELKFDLFDKDQAGTVMFEELRRDIAMAGFYNTEMLQHIWRRCDINQNNSIEFPEFLYMLYEWQNANKYQTSSMAGAVVNSGFLNARRVDLYSAFFKMPENRKIVIRAFVKLEELYKQFDADNNRRFSLQELHTFLHNQLFKVYQNPITANIIHSFYPPGQPAKEIDFPDFLGLVYLCCFEYEKANAPQGKSRLKGRYVKDCLPSSPLRDGFNKQNVMGLFNVLEHDFKEIDVDGNGRLDLVEFAAAQPPMSKDKQLDFHARLQHKIAMVDVDHTGDVCFFQFGTLSYLMCLDGAYQQLVPKTKGHAVIKKSIIGIHSYIQRLTKGKLRLSWQLVEIALKHIFREHPVPSHARQWFERLKYKSKSTGTDVLDILRFLKMLYILILPHGKFHPDRYNPPVTQHAAGHMHGAVHEPSPHMGSDEDLIIDPVDPLRIVKGKMLGQGGQGVAYLATYDGKKVCAKYLLGSITPQTLKDLLMEIALMKKLTHPNCHHLVGAKTSGHDVVILTAVCDNGSIFDYYSKKLMPVCKRFNPEVASRLALETAKGLQFMHGLGYMHRDLKSLNVFLDERMVAKLADFGMSTNQPRASDAAGTPQWMAPEVLLTVIGRHSVYDARSDVYSYGVMLWELFHCRVPYADTGMDQMSIVHFVLAGRLHLQVDKSTPSHISGLINKCMSRDPNGRPSFDQCNADLLS